MIKTYSAKPSDIDRKWYVLDASEISLGRLASRAATILLGKTKPMFTAHIDCGDYVIITNAAKLKVTGNKLKDKKYYRHSQHPGGLHTRSLSEQLEIDPNKVIITAVKGMLPNNKLLDGRLKRLKVYSSDEHNHAPQQPINLTLKEGSVPNDPS